MVTAGDGIQVRGYCVRLASLDAPEWNQPAKHRFGFCFNQGKRVKRALKREVEGLGPRRGPSGDRPRGRA